MSKLSKPALLGLVLAMGSLVLLGVALSGLLPGFTLTVQAPGDAQSPAALKIITSQPGIYEVQETDLAPFGMALTSPEALVLFNRGERRPLWVAERGGEAVLRFYAAPFSSPYTRENVYWLSDDPGLLESIGDAEQPINSEASRAEVALLPPPGAMLATLRVEQNLFYSPLVKDGDHWLWAALHSPEAQDFEFEINDLVTGEVRLSLLLWSAVESPQPVDHRLQAYLNDALVVEESWDGSGYHTIQVDLPASSLQEGANRLTLQLPGVEGLPVDIQNLDAFELVYPRQPFAREGRLEIAGTGEALQVSGLEAPVSLYDVTIGADAALLEADLAVDASTGGILFQGEAGRGYILAGEDGYLSPVRLEAARLAPDLRDPQNAAAYLAIGPDDLLGPLAPLLDWRREHGLTTLAVPLQAVYDQFNAGIADPAAIRKLVAATVAWKESPRYLLLVGDASYDPQGYLAPAEANRLPTFFVDTMFGGQTGSDIPFGQELAPGASASEVDPQAATRLAVGRFPARNARQVTTLVEKTLQFERALLDGGLPRSVAAVADGQEPVYRREAQAFLEQFPASYTTELYSPEAGVSGANKEVIALFEGGELFVAYFGHGSLNMWGKDMLFTSQDVEALSNAGRLPVVINMTCLTGLFTHPKQESLAEALLWKDDGGAVAVLAPTSLTLPLDQSDLSDAIVAQLAGAEQPRLGDVLAAARNQIESTEPSMLDVLLTFMLFGDPALSLPGG